MVTRVCRFYLLFQRKRQLVLLLAALLKHGNSGPCWTVNSSVVLAMTVTLRLRPCQEMRSLCLHQTVIIDTKIFDFMQLVTLPSRFIQSIIWFARKTVNHIDSYYRGEINGYDDIEFLFQGLIHLAIRAYSVTECLPLHSLLATSCTTFVECRCLD